MIYSVTELTALLKGAIEDAFPFVWVRGQVSNLARPGSGHLYLTLKDVDACLNVVWFRAKQRRSGGVDPLTGEVFDDAGQSGQAPDRLAETMANGQEILCGGRLTVYPPRGAYQLVVELVQDVGLGRLYLEFEALKKKYAARGYFDAARKRPLPRHPRRVAVVTAPAGAALRDFLRIGGDRGLSAALRIYPTLVQGDEAPAQIAAALDLANAHDWAEVIVLIRGGGSLEDLWAFNTELVAEAIFSARIPVVAGVGHEVDTSLADMIADLRAATPSHAAQLLWPERRELVQTVDTLEIALHRRWKRYLATLAERLRALEKGLVWLSPLQRLTRSAERVDSAATRLLRAWEQNFSRKNERVERFAERLPRAFGPRDVQAAAVGLESLAIQLERAMAAGLVSREQALDRHALALEALNPEGPLKRGYSLVRVQKTGGYLRSVAEVAAGDALDIVVRDGRVAAQVTAAAPRPGD